MTSRVVLVGADRTEAMALGSAVWARIDRAGWLPSEDGVTIWMSRTCDAGAAAAMLQDLRAWLADRSVNVIEGALQTRATLASGVVVESSVLLEGTPLPRPWLARDRLIVVCEQRDAAHGAMTAQAEPLQVLGNYPWFRAFDVALEARRLGAADLVLMRGGTRWLIGPSAPLVDAFAGCTPRRSRVARCAVALANARFDVERAYANLYRVPRFVRKRLRRAEA